MSDNPIYLDHNATTPLAAEAATAMLACEREAWGNPASAHSFGRRARRCLEEARDGIALLLGADAHSAHPDRLLFTSGGTEANNLALFGLCRNAAEPGRLIISTVEHPSVAGPAAELARQGWELIHAPVASDGALDLTRLEEILSSCRSGGPENLPVVVSLMLGNNETGVLQPIQHAAALCRTAGALLHTDAVQVAGKLAIDVKTLGIHALSISAHKFHGPRGIGALWLRSGIHIQPRIVGGFQQAGLRAGTESVQLAVGMHTALQLAHAELEARALRMRSLRDHLEEQLLAGWPNAVVHGSRSSRLPHTSNVSFVGLDRQALQMALDLAGVACSTGSACASGSTDPSPTLIAMGCSEEQLHSSLRFSVGASTTLAEIEEAARRILFVCKELQSSKRGRNLAAVGRNPA